MRGALPLTVNELDDGWSLSGEEMVETGGGRCAASLVSCPSAEVLAVAKSTDQSNDHTTAFANIRIILRR